jgi:hypothetical protein
MITVVILVGALFPILDLFSSGFVASSDAEIFTKAFLLCQKKTEEIRALPYELVDIGEDEITLGGVLISNVNSSLSDPDFENGLRAVLSVYYVDENFEIVQTNQGLKKISCYSFSKEKEKITLQTTIESLKISYD